MGRSHFLHRPARHRPDRDAPLHLLPRHHGARKSRCSSDSAQRPACRSPIGYHRLFAHSAFKASPIVQFFVLLFGAATFEESALKWASQHRQHHRFTDTEHDPYGVNHGFWHAHIGWIMFWRHRTNYNNVKDLRRSRLVAWQHDHHAWWSVGGGVALPMLIAWWIGHPLGGFIMAVCLRIIVVLHSSFFINSFAHTFGEQPYDQSNSARDNWLCALLTNGEGFHNYHHRFPIGLPQRLPLVSLGPVEVAHLRAVEGGPRLGSPQDFRPANRRGRGALASRPRAGADRRRRTRASCNPRVRRCRPDAPTT